MGGSRGRFGLCQLDFWLIFGEFSPNRRALDLTESYVPSIRAACAGAGLGRVCVPGAPTPLAAMIKRTCRAAMEQLLADLRN